MCKECNLEYENIHSHSMYSNIYTADSIISKEDIAKRAVELGQKTLSLVEHGYFGNIFETYQIAEKYNLNLIFGSELYFVKDRFAKDNTNSHLLVIAKNEKGREEITSIISESNKTGFYFKPRIDEELLFGLTPENVIVTSACIASPLNKYDDEYASYFVEKCKKHFGENFYLEIQPHTNIKQVAFNQKLQRLKYEHGVEFILGIDSHYIHAEDAKDRDLFLKGKKINYPEEDGFIIDYPTVDDILHRLQDQNVLFEREIKEAFDNTLIAREFEPVKLDYEIKMPTIYPELNHEQKSKKLKEVITKAWIEDRKHIDKEKWPEYLEAIRFETDIITETNMEDYFLINQKIIDKALNEYGGVLTKTGRGSGPSFYTNKLLGFTEIDRLEAPIQLYATRFMSKSRILETKSLPDVDFNTANPEPFIKASRDFLGEDNVYWMIAYGTMQESEAFRNYCRAIGYEASDVNIIGKDLDSYRNDAKWGKIIKDSEMFVGVIDSISPHPCANILLSEPISKKLGVIKVGDEFVALIDSYHSDVYKYLKNDYLTVTVWNIIAKTYERINQPIDDVRSLIKKTEGDTNVWELYKAGLVSTLNQAGTASGKPQIIQYEPQSIRELSGWVSAIRPAFSSMKHYFLNRKEFSYGIPEFDAILKESDNFILYQENIMATLVYSGFSEDETYGLLKAIAKKKEGIIEPIQERFMKGFIDKTGSEENALRVWKILEDSVGYSFNASHAYAVALDSLYGAYLKTNYPLEYFSVILNIYHKNVSKQGEIIDELKHFGIKLFGIEFGKSGNEYSIDKEAKTIYKGLGSIKFMNKDVADGMMKLFENKYEKNEFYLLCKDIMDESVANKRQMETLIRLDFFKYFGKSSELLEIYFCMKDEKKANFKYIEFANHKKVPLKYDKSHIEKTKDKRLENLRLYEVVVKENPPIDFSMYEKLRYEKDNLGYYVTTYPQMKNDAYIVMEMNLTHTPVIELYSLKTGEISYYKIKKDKFYVEDLPIIKHGNIIKIKEQHEEFGWKKVEDKWERNESRVDKFIDRLIILR